MKRKPRRQGRKRAGGRFKSGAVSRYQFHAPKHFTEVIRLGDLVSPPSGSIPAGFNFPIEGQLINNLNGAIFDVFRQFAITGIKLMYLPAYNTYPLVAGVAFIPKIFYSEDKSSYVPDNSSGNIDRMLQQDNLKILDSSKKWSHYISKPRPWLNQANGGSMTATPVQQPAKQLQWLTTKEEIGVGSSGMTVPHLHSSLVVDANNSGVGITTGTLWARVYYCCKEQW